jgi:hypothetical protein
MNVIHSKQIIDEVRDQLYSWEALNKLDESYMEPVLKRCLSKLGPEYMEETTKMVNIRAGQAPLPKDFQFLTSAYVCFHHEYTRPDPTHALITQEVYDIPEQNVFDVKIDDCGRPYQIVQKLRVETFEWNTFEVLSTTKTTPCSNYCINRQSTNPKTIDIRNGVIHTNFLEGAIYMTYLRVHEDETGYFIPDYSAIVDWVKAELVYESLRILQLNGTPGIEQAVSTAVITLNDARKEYTNLRKRTSVQGFYDLTNIMVKRFNAMSNGILRDTRYDRR